MYILRNSRRYRHCEPQAKQSRKTPQRKIQCEEETLLDYFGKSPRNDLKAQACVLTFK
jgi:hypothetical protein